MRKYLFLLLIMMLLSCSNHTDGNIVGEWTSIEEEDDGDLSWMKGKTIYTFNADGTYIKANHSWIGNKEFQRTSSGDWNRKGDILLMKEVKSTDKSLLDEERKIIELTDNFLKIRPVGESDLEWSFKRVK